MSDKLNLIKQFLTVYIWNISSADVSTWRYMFYKLIKTLYLSIRFFTTKRIIDYASALTYSTLLAIVPICAVVFAIARGFGYSIYIETWFRSVLNSQPQVADTIIGFVNSYLVHTKSGVFLGVGLVFMLYTIIMLTRKAEQTFNDIWNVKSDRNIIRTFIDYVAMFFIIPILIVLTSGLSIYLAAMSHETSQYMLLGTMVKVLLSLLPFVIMSVVFILFYIFMPNTNVKISSTILPGIFSGIAMQLLQFVYINSQIFLSSYNAIYGSFAALPLFMLWLQLSWTICLFGAELCYTHQNLERIDLNTNVNEVSHRYKIFLYTMLLSKICKRFEVGANPYTAKELKLEFGLSIRVVQSLLDKLVEARLLSKSILVQGQSDPIYLPIKSPENISVGMIVDRLEAYGQCHLALNLKHSFVLNEEWKKYCALRKNYLNDLRHLSVVKL